MADWHKLGHGHKLSSSAAREQQLWGVIKYVVPIVLVAALSSFLVFYFGMGPTIKELSVTNAEQLKEVFFSGQPWVVVCKGKDGAVPDIVATATEELRTLRVNTGAMNCSDKLPDSGRTVFERFNIPYSRKPVVLLAVNGQRPVQIAEEHFKTVQGFVSYISGQSTIRILQPKNQAELDTACLSKKTCAIITARQKLSDYHVRVLRDVMLKHRNIVFAFFNTKKRPLKLGIDLPEKDEPVVVVAKTDSSKGSGHFNVFVHEGDFSSSGLLSFFRKDITGSGIPLKYEPLVKISRSSEEKSDASARKERREAERSKQRTERGEPEPDVERERQRRQEMEDEAQAFFDGGEEEESGASEEEVEEAEEVAAD